jgi:hypothetical protein
VLCASSDPVLTRIAALPARKVKAVQSELMKVKDHRIKVTNEALQNVKVSRRGSHASPTCPACVRWCEAYS